VNNQVIKAAVITSLDVKAKLTKEVEEQSHVNMDSKFSERRMFGALMI
jgi:hypothetical protein